MDTEPLVFVGIDWASTEHQVCLIGADSPVQRVFAHDADGIGAMVDWLCAQAEQPGQVAVAIETPHGSIVEALVDRGVAVFAIKSKQLQAKAPTPADAMRLTETKIAKVLVAHRIRRITAHDVLAILRRPALTVTPGTADPARAHITAVAERLNLVNCQIKTVTRCLDGLVEQLAGPETEPGQDTEQRDAAILRSLPGVGRIVLATLLAEAHQAIQARDYHALRTLTGVAPVTKRSGKSCRVEMRQACSGRLRTAVYHWARVATQHDARSRSRYAALRRRGHSHGRALRTVADRLLGIACVMLTNRTMFDPEKLPADRPKSA